MLRRNTPAKQKILQLLSAADSALSQDMLEEKLRGSFDRVTIYRVLAGFCEDGLAHRIVSDEGKAFYALCTGCRGDRHRHEHAHFRCVECRRVECLPFETKPKLPAGYSLQSMNYWISGYCGACSGS